MPEDTLPKRRLQLADPILPQLPWDPTASRRTASWPSIASTPELSLHQGKRQSPTAASLEQQPFCEPAAGPLPKPCECQFPASAVPPSTPSTRKFRWPPEAEPLQQ